MSDTKQSEQLHDPITGEPADAKNNAAPSPDKAPKGIKDRPLARALSVVLATFVAGAGMMVYRTLGDKPKPTEPAKQEAKGPEQPPAPSNASLPTEAPATQQPTTSAADPTNLETPVQKPEDPFHKNAPGVVYQKIKHMLDDAYPSGVKLKGKYASHRYDTRRVPETDAAVRIETVLLMNSTLRHEVADALREKGIIPARGGNAPQPLYGEARKQVATNDPWLASDTRFTTFLLRVTPVMEPGDLPPQGETRYEAPNYEAQKAHAMSKPDDGVEMYIAAVGQDGKQHILHLYGDKGAMRKADTCLGGAHLMLWPQNKSFGIKLDSKELIKESDFTAHYKGTLGKIVAPLPPEAAPNAVAPAKLSKKDAPYKTPTGVSPKGQPQVSRFNGPRFV